jgi:type IV fimbrial biogenesis protein FimT
MADTNAYGALSCRSKGHGFTLIELLVAIAIAAVLAAIALPGYQELMIRMSVSETTNDLVLALNTARAEAVKRGSDVTLKPAVGGWSAGWTLSAVVDPSTILLTHAAVATHYKVMAGGVLGGAPVASTQITFGATGGLKGADSFDLNACRPDFNPGDAQSRRISIKGSGTISSQRDTTGSNAGSCA